MAQTAASESSETPCRHHPISLLFPPSLHRCHCVFPSPPLSLPTLLSAAAAAVRSLSHGSGLHALSLSLGLLPANSFTISRIAAFYAACGLLDYARAAVEDSTAAVAFPWNIVISAYLEKGYWQDAIFSYGVMLERGIKPDKFSNSSILKACGELRELELGKEVHRNINSSDLECDLFAYNALLAMYAKCGAVYDARKVFDQMPERDIISWNSMVLAYTSEGRWEESSELLEKMRLEGFELNSLTSNTIITDFELNFELNSGIQHNNFL